MSSFFFNGGILFSAWKLSCISAVLWNEPLSFLQLFMLPLSLHLPQRFFFSSRACGLRWQAAMMAPLISAGGPGVQVGPSHMPNEGWTTHLLLLTAVSRPAPWNPFIPQPYALLSAMGWHWVQSHTCSPVLSFVSLLSRAMQGIHFCLTVDRFLNCYSWHILVLLCLCRDKVAVTLLLQSLTWRQRSMCRCPKVMSTKRRR